MVKNGETRLGSWQAKGRVVREDTEQVKGSDLSIEVVSVDFAPTSLVGGEGFQPPATTAGSGQTPPGHAAPAGACRAGVWGGERCGPLQRGIWSSARLCMCG